MAGTIGQGGTPEKRPVVPYLGAVKVAAAVMGVMIIVGLAVLGITVAKRVGGAKPAASVASAVPATMPVSGATPAAFGDVSLRLPPRARVIDMVMDSSRLVVQLQVANGDRALLVVDLQTGRQLGLIHLERDPQLP